MLLSSNPAKKHLEKLKVPKKYDRSENDIGQLYKAISELTKELKDIKNILKMNGNVVHSRRKIALASLDVAAHATSKLNLALKRLLSKHEVYTPRTKKMKLEKEPTEKEESIIDHLTTCQLNA